MNQTFAAVLAATLMTVIAALPTANVAAAHDSYSHIRGIHIDRQCDRYGNFCGQTLKVSKKKSVAKKRVVQAKGYKVRSKVTYRSSEAPAFIERQCTRYGHFC